MAMWRAAWCRIKRSGLLKCRQLCSSAADNISTTVLLLHWYPYICASHIIDRDRRMPVSAWAWERRNSTKTACCIVKLIFTKSFFSNWVRGGEEKPLLIIRNMWTRGTLLEIPQQTNLMTKSWCYTVASGMYQMKSCFKNKDGGCTCDPSQNRLNRLNLQFAFSGLACLVMLCHFSVVSTHVHTP